MKGWFFAVKAILCLVSLVVSQRVKIWENREIYDPLNWYGKKPWKYYSYGYGIGWGLKKPGYMYEQGFGYIRALGRDFCRRPPPDCSPKDPRPFIYRGRKEPYFGYMSTPTLFPLFN